MNLIRIRARQGHRTSEFPAGSVSLPERFRGRPVIDAARCPDGCRACADACPTDAILVAADGQPARLDLGRCVFCQDCVSACPEEAITYTQDYRMATRSRGDLVQSTGVRLAAALDRRMSKLYGRSLMLRHVSAGDCSGCSVELQALGNVVFDLARFGVKFVASPRHADGLVITGPVTHNMRLALAKTWEAMAPPRLVIAVGACAISGGPFRDDPQVMNGAEGLVPVDLYIPGCPPHPLTILDGILRLLGRAGPADERGK